MKLLKFFFFWALLLILCVIVYSRSYPSAPEFSLEKENTLDNGNILFETGFIPQPDFILFAHSPTLTRLSNGDLLALWFAGSDEGKPDVKIWQSKCHDGVWEIAHPVVSPELISKETRRYVRKVGNPVVYRTDDGILHLFVVTAIGGWAASSLNELDSYDEGKTWQNARRLVLTPFFDLSTLCRTSPVALKDGGFYLPVYHESIRDYPEILRFDSAGNFVNQIRMTSHNDVLQPSIVPLNKQKAYAFFRNNGNDPKILYRQQTNNCGLEWGSLEATNLTNPNSSLVVKEILPGKFLMVHNPNDRCKIALSTSNDGINWQEIYTLDNMTGESFSYPAIYVHDDITDILYSWKKQKIKHVKLNLAWLKTKGFLNNEYNSK
jgi:predicted neuraminidase